MKILLTGGAGFIGSHLLERLILRGDTVTVVDDLNDFYDPALKRSNLAAAEKVGPFTFVERDLRTGLRDLLPADAVIHLAARAGVRPSLANPELYHDVNVNGTVRLLEDCRRTGTKRVLFASSSSVYGNGPAPFCETAAPLDPISPYGATKLIGEAYLRVYSKMGLHATALRFFTVYGPRHRPDMAIRMFAEKIVRDEPIPVFGDGTTERDYTYIDDILQGILSALDRDEEWGLYNLGESRTVPLAYLIELLEKNLGRKARLQRMAEQVGDVRRTYASIERARTNLKYHPQVPIEEGIRRFAEWLKAR